LAIEIDPDLIAQLRVLSKPDRRRVGLAIEAVRSNWGRPHLHAGAGIRRLAPGLYESRAGLQQRLIFQDLDGCLYFHYLGSHDEVQKFLRSHA
jgi:hypothetical protein